MRAPVPAAASFLALLAGATLALPAAAQDPGVPAAPRVHVTLEPPVIGVGEVARLSLTLEAGPGVSDLRQPTFELENLELVGGPSRVENLTVVNGRASRTLRLVWYLKPRQAGAARVHDLRMGIGDRTVDLPDQALEVTEAPQQRPRRPRDAGRSGTFDDLLRELFEPRGRLRPTPAGPPEIRLEARVRPRSPYAGQQAVYELSLLVERRRPGEGQGRVESIFPRELPAFEGFWSQEIPLPEHLRPEVTEIDGRLFWRQPVLKRAVFPLRPGERRIDPALLELRVVHHRPSIFGDEPAGPETVEVRSPPVVVAAMPLPPAPRDFSGAVGQFTLAAELEPRVLETDEAATLVLGLSGEGRLGGVEDPSLPPIRGLEIHGPTETSDRRVAGNRVSESRTWRWTLVPSREGRWTIPPLEWTYFDPRAEGYRTQTSGSLRLAAAGPAPSPAPAAVPEPAPDAVSLDLDPPAEPSDPDFDPLPPVPLLLVASGVALVLLAVGLRVLGRRQGSSGRDLLARLRSLPPDDTRRAAAATEDAWCSYLQCQWGLPPGVPSRAWEEHLRKQGADPETVRELVRLVDDLHYLRYAPQLARSDALQEELLPRSKRILRKL